MYIERSGLSPRTDQIEYVRQDMMDKSIAAAGLLG